MLKILIQSKRESNEKGFVVTKMAAVLIATNTKQINFLSYFILNSHSFKRVVCIFVSADDFSEPVKVCYTHCRDSSGNLKCEIAEHLVRCSHPSSLYEMNQSMYKTIKP